MAVTGALDPARELTWSQLGPPKSQTNNTGAQIADLTGYMGKVAVNVQLGLKTAGDSDMAIAIRVMTSATNNISNATNYTPAIGSATVSTTNNTTTSGQITVDTRDTLGPYLFYGVTLTGTNSPAVPIAVSCVGTQASEP